MTDKISTPGFLWPYGNPWVKEQLATMRWNSMCCDIWSKKLSRKDMPLLDRKMAANHIEYAENLLRRQSEDLLKMLEQHLVN